MTAAAEPATAGMSEGVPGQRARAPWLVVPAMLLVAVILLFPLVLLFRYSLNRYDRLEFMIEAVSVENYVRFFTDDFYRSVLWRTVEVAAISTAVTLVLALPVAYFVSRAPARWKSILIILTVFPLFVGNAVRAAGWMAVLGSRGFLNETLVSTGLIGQPLELLYTKTAVIVGIVAVVLPFMILSIQSVMEGVDVSLEEAAQNLGASPLTAFRKVVLPLALPGVIAGSLLVFILCMNAYATPVLLGGPRFHVMAPKVYEQITGQSNWPFGAAMAFILMTATLVLTVLSTWLLQRRYAR
ncbi:MAG TPA: ABC transporter permease [Azospirillaceae bacterium]|nr:ABC transporter permease [Azospirillaceae bacterium]